MVLNFENFDKINERKKMNLDITHNIKDGDNELIKNLVNKLSFIIYKQEKNPKSLRIKNIKGYNKKQDFKNFNLIYKTKIIVELTNYDTIEGKFSNFENSTDNNIIIKINNKIVYNIDNQNFNDEILIDKMKFYYEKNLQKNNWKLK